MPGFFGMEHQCNFPLRKLFLAFRIVPRNPASITSNNLPKEVWIAFKPYLMISADLYVIMFLFFAEKSWQSISLSDKIISHVPYDSPTVLYMSWIVIKCNKIDENSKLGEFTNKERILELNDLHEIKVQNQPEKTFSQYRLSVRLYAYGWLKAPAFHLNFCQFYLHSNAGVPHSPPPFF